MHSKITYNPLQKETERYINEDTNVVVLAPTSSGKTIVAEQFFLPMLRAGKKVLYLSPLKALTSEKLEDWAEWPWKLVAFTGDHETTMRPVTEQMVLMTTEALDSKSRGKREFLKEIGVIVCDEAHLLATPLRGDAFEVGLTRFTQQNPNARVIFLSATIPNAQELGKWLTTLNGKETRIVETDWRPVEQEHFFIPVRVNNIYEFHNNAIKEVAEILRRHRDKQTLIFVHSIATGEALARTFHAPFHYSKITKEKRAEIEENFRARNMRVLVATSTLAAGVNLPADVGIIFGGHRGPTLVEASEIKQMAGRIGRYGLSDKGTVYYLFEESYASEMEKAVKDVPPIYSQLERRFYFHLVSLIARENLGLEEIIKFLERTLYAQQFGQEKMHKMLVDALQLLFDLDIVQKIDGRLATTPIGKAAAMMYVDPIDLYHVKSHLKDMPMTPSIIAGALVGIPSLEVHTYVPKYLNNPMSFPYGAQVVLGTYLRDWLTGIDIGGAGMTVVLPFAKDFERIAAALRMTGFQKNYVDSLSLMVRYGIDHNLIELVQIEGIGRKRALALNDRGITDKASLLAKENVARNVLGAKLFTRVKYLIEHPNGLIAP